MSYAIFELEITQPPATAHQHAGGWYIRCHRCAKRSPLTALLSEALAVHDDHAVDHTFEDALALEDILSTTRRRCVVHGSSTGDRGCTGLDRRSAFNIGATRKEVA